MELDPWVIDRLSEVLIVPKETITPEFIQEMKNKEEAYKGSRFPNILWVMRLHWAKEIIDSQK